MKTYLLAIYYLFNCNARLKAQLQLEELRHENLLKQLQELHKNTFKDVVQFYYVPDALNDQDQYIFNFKIKPYLFSEVKNCSECKHYKEIYDDSGYCEGKNKMVKINEPCIDGILNIKP